MRVLLIDAFDSFIYVISQYYEKLGVETKVVRVNDNPMNYYLQWKPHLLVLGPGPGTPNEHGYLDIMSKIDKEQAVFGICLGHQAIGEYYGWKLVHAPSVEHGKMSEILHDGQGIFQGLYAPINAVRYHSLIIKTPDNETELITTAYTKNDRIVMGIRHKTGRIEGVQFHPESIGTEFGNAMIKNSLDLFRK